MAITLADWLNDGTLPQNKTSGNWTPSAFNTGRFRQRDWAPTNASTHASWRPTSLTFWALLTTNEANGSGVWLEWDPGTGKHRLLFVASDGSTILAAIELTWSAAQSMTYVVDQSSGTAGASTMTLSGASTGNGTSAGFTRQSVFSGANLYLGVWGSGGFSLNASTFGDIDDGNDAIAGTLAATLGAVTSSAAATVDTDGALTSTLGALTSAAAGTVDTDAAANIALGAATLSATGQGPETNEGTLNATLGAVVAGGGTGTVDTDGSLDATLGALTSSGAAHIGTEGAAAATLGALTLVAADSAFRLGDYGSARVLYGTAAGTVTATLDTQVSGSTFLVCVGGNLGDLAADPPTDSKGNTFTLVGSPEEYQRWAGYGMRLYQCVDGIGGAGHAFSQEFGQSAGFDEMTIAVVEIENAAHVQQAEVSQQLTGQALITDAVTTTAPAVLVVFFSGDAPTGSTTAVSFNNGFTLIDDTTFVDHPNGYVPIGIAYRDAATPGSYNTTASETPDQGAIQFIVAVQEAEGRIGSAAVTLGSVTSSAAASVDTDAALARTLGALTGSAAATVDTDGALSSTLGAVVSSAAGHVATDATAAPTLGTLESAGGGEVATDAALDVTLGGLTASATGTGAGATEGQFDAALGTLSGAGAGEVATDAVAGPTLGTLTGDGAGEVATDGTLAQSLGGLVLAAAGVGPDSDHPGYADYQATIDVDPYVTGGIPGTYVSDVTFFDDQEETMSYSIVAGATSPPLQMTATVNGVAEPITDATVLQMRWRKPDGTVSTVALTAVDLSLGQVKRTWASGDTDIPGLHSGRLYITRPTGVEVFPSNGTDIVWNVLASW